MYNVIVVFTSKGMNRILADGGSSGWKLDPKRAADCEYFVCTRNAKGRPGHRAAFFIGKLDKVSLLSEELPRKRYMLTFTEFAKVEIPNVWRGDRNPVRYTTMEELGIDPTQHEFGTGLIWKPAVEQSAAEEAAVPANRSLTIEQAKAGLSAKFGVPPDQIEITIRA
jgi:hypothetical protein